MLSGGSHCTTASLGSEGRGRKDSWIWIWRRERGRKLGGQKDQGRTRGLCGTGILVLLEQSQQHGLPLVMSPVSNMGVDCNHHWAPQLIHCVCLLLCVYKCMQVSAIYVVLVLFLFRFPGWECGVHGGIRVGWGHLKDGTIFFFKENSSFCLYFLFFFLLEIQP